MNNKMMWVLVVVALLVGAYAGYAYEKAKFVKLMATQFQDMQRQINDAKVANQESAAQNDIVMMANNATLGTYGIAANGMALYTYDKDTEGKSNCVDVCAKNWPPYVVVGTVPSKLPERVGLVQRVDGSMQYTWDGKPLYYYAKDTTKEDVTGDGVGGVWHIVK